MIRFLCPGCRVQLECFDEHAGHAVLCPACGAKALVPSISEGLPPSSRKSLLVLGKSLRDLEEKIIQLESHLGELARELRLAHLYVKSDPGSSLTKSRIVLEQLVCRLYQTLMGREPKKPLLGDMLVDNQFARLIERRILSRMNAVRDMANLGPHGGYVEAVDAARCLEDTCVIIDWYVKGRDSRTTSALTASGPVVAITNKQPLAPASPGLKAPTGNAATNPPRRGRRRHLLAGAAFLLFVVGVFWLLRGILIAPGSDNKDRDGADTGTQAIYELVFDGRGSHVLLPKIGLRPALPYTIEAWVRSDTEPEETDSKYVLVGGGIWLQFHAKGQWNFRSPTKNPTPAMISSKQMAKRGSWTHLAAVSDGVERRFFVDGRAQGKSPMQTTASDDPEFSLGALAVVGPKDTARGFFEGVIREVRFSKVARYPQAFTPAKRFQPDGETLALYHCDEGQGDGLKDSSGNDCHGRIVGARWVKSTFHP